MPQHHCQTDGESLGGAAVHCNKREPSSVWQSDCFNIPRRRLEAELGHMNSSIFSTVNPATGEQIETFTFFPAQETEAALARAAKSFKSYRKLCVHQRAQLLSTLATTLRTNKAQLAKVITTEMGKILSEAEAEVE